MLVALRNDCVVFSFKISAAICSLHGYKVILCVCVCTCVYSYSYVEGFWGVLVFLLLAGGLLPASSLINSPVSCITHTHTLMHTHKPATLSLRVRRRCEGIAAKVLKMLLSIKSLRRRHRAPLLLFMSSLCTISMKAFTREEIHTLPPAQVWFLVVGDLLLKFEP